MNNKKNHEQLYETMKYTNLTERLNSHNLKSSPRFMDLFLFISIGSFVSEKQRV